MDCSSYCAMRISKTVLHFGSSYGLVILLLTTISGCSEKGVHLVPVTGLVTLDGKPVADAGVVFTPVSIEQGPSASGSTDSEGKFVLMTNNRDGAVLGDHRVSISKADPFGEVVSPEAFENADLIRKRGLAIKTKHFLPERYANVETSELLVTVKEEPNELNFELTSTKK